MGDKKFVVSQVKQDREMMGIAVDGKFLPWGKNSRSFYVSDASVAKDIEQSVGQKGSKDVIVSEVQKVNKDTVHNYTFTVKKPDLEKEDTHKYEWVEVSPGKHKMVRKEK